MPKELPVIAAIPNYNMGDNLSRLLPQVLAQHYNAVFMLDDASTYHSVDVVSGFGGEVKLLRSPENRGAGADRYGPAPVFSVLGTSVLPVVITGRLPKNPRLAAAIRRVAAPVVRDWPNILESPTAAPAYWLHEGNMLVYSSLFRSVGGYDPMLRAHEIQDLAIRLEKLGIKRQFDPSVRVVHHHIDVGGKNRLKWENKAIIYLIRKHGLFHLLTDR